MMIPSIFRMKKDEADEEIIEVRCFVFSYFIDSKGIPQCAAVVEETGGYFHAECRAFTAQMPKQTGAANDATIIQLNQ